MHFEHLYDPDLAQGSYLIGCPASGVAVVVDPRRDVEVYLRAAAARGLRITDVTETHVHADYLSGARELADRAGARLWLSDEGGPDWRYRFEGAPLGDGDEIRVGNVTLRALHTPGHTPEHLSFLVIDGAAGDEPRMLLSGDFVFVGDVGRPDLLDEAAGGVDTRFAGARQLFASLRDVLLALPDHVQVWPGHGAGSACGKSMASVASSTVGFERRTAWWAAALDRGDVSAFTGELLSGQPDAPHYFARMKRLNLAGPPLLGERGPVPELDPAEEAAALAAGRRVLVDTRPLAAWSEDAVIGALHVPAGGRFATYASYALDPEADPRELVLVAPHAAAAAELRDRLARIGVDRVAGFVPGVEAFPRAPVPRVAPAELERLPDAFVLDVRSAEEHARGRIEGAERIHLGRLLGRLDELPRDRPLVAHCQSGVRASVAASLLRARGFGDVVELEGSYRAWRAYRASRE